MNWCSARPRFVNTCASRKSAKADHEVSRYVATPSSKDVRSHRAGGSRAAGSIRNSTEASRGIVVEMHTGFVPVPRPAGVTIQVEAGNVELSPDWLSNRA